MKMKFKNEISFSFMHTLVCPGAASSAVLVCVGFQVSDRGSYIASRSVHSISSVIMIRLCYTSSSSEHKHEYATPFVSRDACAVSPFLSHLLDVQWAQPFCRADGSVMLDCPPFLNSMDPFHSCGHAVLNLERPEGSENRARPRCSSIAHNSCAHSSGLRDSNGSNSNSSKDFLDAGACFACTDHMMRVATTLWTVLFTFKSPAGDGGDGVRLLSALDAALLACDAPCALAFSAYYEVHVVAEAVLLRLKQMAASALRAHSPCRSGREDRPPYSYCDCLASICLDLGMYASAAALVQSTDDCESLLNLLSERASSAPPDTLLMLTLTQREREVRETLRSLRHSVRPAQLTPSARKLFQLQSFLCGEDLLADLQHRFSCAFSEALMQRVVFVGDAVSRSAQPRPRIQSRTIPQPQPARSRSTDVKASTQTIKSGIRDTGSEEREGTASSEIENTRKRRRSTEAAIAMTSRTDAVADTNAEEGAEEGKGSCAGGTLWETLDAVLDQDLLTPEGMAYKQRGVLPPQGCSCHACANLFGFEEEYGTDTTLARLKQQYAWSLEPPHRCVRAVASAWIQAIDSSRIDNGGSAAVLHGVERGGIVSWCFSSRKMFRLRLAPWVQMQMQMQMQMAHTSGKVRTRFSGPPSHNMDALLLLHPSPLARVSLHLDSDFALACTHASASSAVAADRVHAHEQAMHEQAMRVHVHVHASMLSASLFSGEKQTPQAATAIASADAVLQSISTLALSQASVLDACSALLVSPAPAPLLSHAVTTGVSNAAPKKLLAARMILASMWNLKTWARGPRAAAGPALNSFCGDERLDCNPNPLSVKAQTPTPKQMLHTHSELDLDSDLDSDAVTCARAHANAVPFPWPPAGWSDAVNALSIPVTVKRLEVYV